MLFNGLELVPPDNALPLHPVKEVTSAPTFPPVCDVQHAGNVVPANDELVAAGAAS